MIPHTLTKRIQKFHRFYATDVNSYRKNPDRIVGLINAHLEANQRTITKIGEQYMSRKNKKSDKFIFKGYANINIPQSHTEKVTSFVSDNKEIYSSMNQLLLEGYSMKVYYDKDKEYYRASLTCMNADDVNFGYVLSAFAGDWQTALAVVVYKHFYIALEQWDIVPAIETGSFG